MLWFPLFLNPHTHSIKSSSKTQHGVVPFSLHLQPSWSQQQHQLSPDNCNSFPILHIVAGGVILKVLRQTSLPYPVWPPPALRLKSNPLTMAWKFPAHSFPCPLFPLLTTPLHLLPGSEHVHLLFHLPHCYSPSSACLDPSHRHVSAQVAPL